MKSTDNINNSKYDICRHTCMLGTEQSVHHTSWQFHSFVYICIIIKAGMPTDPCIRLHGSRWPVKTDFGWRDDSSVIDYSLVAWSQASLWFRPTCDKYPTLHSECYLFLTSRSLWKRACRSIGVKSVGVPPLIPGVDPRPLHGAFMVDEMGMDQVSQRLLHPFSTGVVPSVLHTLSFIYYLRYVFLAIDRIHNTPSIYGNEYSQTSIHERLRSWTIRFTNKFSEHKASRMTYCVSNYEHFRALTMKILLLSMILCL